MRSGVLSLIGVVLVAISPGVLAQAPATPAQVQDVRRQIEQLQHQLDRLQAGAAKNERVTEIGSQRLTPRDVGRVVRLYDLSDLFAMAPNYVAREPDDLHHGSMPMFPVTAEATSGAVGGAMGGGGGMYNVEPEKKRALPAADQHVAAQMNGSHAAQPGHDDSRTSLDGLVEAIKSTISPAEWTDVGGLSSIARLGKALLINAEPSTHDQIDSLLGLFRQRWRTSRTISVRAYWLWLTETQLATLLPEPPNDTSGYGLVAEDAWKIRPATDAKLGPGYRVAVTCYNGQTVSAVAGSQSPIVTGVGTSTIQSAGQPATVSYHSVVTTLSDGAALQVTPLASASGKFVVFDLHSRVVRVRSSPAEAKPGDRKAATPAAIREVIDAIDRPTISAQRISTTLRAPVGRVVLVGGMTFDADVAPQDPQLYLFVRASVQEFSDDVVSPPTKQDEIAN